MADLLKKLALVFGLLLAAAPAAAGTFCLKLRGEQPQCFYDDAGDCRRRAAQLNGLCTVNPDMLTITATNGQFCLVTSTRAIMCDYPDRGSCEQEARRHNGACIDSTVQGIQPNLHREDPNLPY